MKPKITERNQHKKNQDRWLVLLRPDGLVESVEDGAPVTWVGHKLADVSDIPDGLRAQVVDLLQCASATGYVHRRTFDWAQPARNVEVELLLIEGLPLRRAHTRIPELVMRTLDVFAAQAHSSEIDLNIEQAAGVPPVLVIDGEKIAWALATLVANALRFAQQRKSKTGAPHIRVKVGWNQAAEELVVVVSDNGPGMSEHRARWLFERDPATGQSAGLALLMVRDVMVAHRGSVEVESAIDRGTTFTLRIPRIHS
jgi:signal transduction histidine kinase